jgi:DNA-3-methyladenine glycosylase
MARLLPLNFFNRDTETVARELLGCTLVHIVNGTRLSGMIVETEAYLGIKDRACHSFGGRRTNRTESLYLRGGAAYVYFVYGMHYCFNVVTRDTRHPEAVLIRALEPLEGIDEMRARRKGVTSDRQLTNGPAKLCQALGIDASCDRKLLTSEPLFLEHGSKGNGRANRFEIEASPRIGIDYAKEAAPWPLRFSMRGNAFVSRRPKT